MYIRTKDELESRDHQYSIVSWRASIFGLSWIGDLVKSGRAIDLGGDGYPSRYSIKAEVLRSILSKGHPTYNIPLIVGEDSFIPEGYNSPLEINYEKLYECPDNEELIIVAWDQS